MLVTCDSAPVDPNAGVSNVDVTIKDQEEPKKGGRLDDANIAHPASGLSYARYGGVSRRGGLGKFLGKRNAFEIPAFDQTEKPSLFYYAAQNDLKLVL